MKHLTIPLILVILASIITERALKSIALEKEVLNQQMTALLEEKERAMKIQEKLLLIINSQSDPAWIELVLFRELGLVPEGAAKVWFKTP
ncbi:MAG: hypothetical protein ACK5MA_09335 [Parachlamydiaceae bacterium]